MNILFGRSGKLAFYGNDDYAVVLDTTLDVIVASGDSSSLTALHGWSSSSEDLSNGQKRLCNLSLDSYESETLLASSGRRMYSIPEGVQNEAKKALEWRKEHKRGGTSVGLNTARRLAKGGQIGLEKVRHIAKYFPRHEVDKKGKGWAPGDAKFPSNGRIAWALWGGDAAKRWASAIVERENKKTITAGGGLDPFKAAYELEEGYAPEFMARVGLDDGGIDRLYKIEANGEVCVWDDGIWDDMGAVNGDVWSYDRDLDGDGMVGKCSHILIDIESAVFIASRLAVNPFGKVTVDDIDEDEALLTRMGMPGEDWEMIDRVMYAAGEPILAATPGSSEADKDGDGKVDSDFLSEKAETQPRDAAGLFIKVGSRTVVGGDKERGSGVIDSIDYKNDKVNVRLDTGKMIAVGSKYLRAEKDFDGPTMVPKSTNAPLNLDGILGEPRTPRNMPKAQLPETLPRLTTAEVNKLITDWDSWVEEQRKSYKLLKDDPKGMRAFDKKYIKDRYKLKDSEILAGAVTSAATPGKLNTPATAEIARYLAIVSPDDVQAVMDLIAIVSEVEGGSTPVVYRREEGKWVRDDQILNDLKSPTPPPVVELKEKELVNDVLVQVDDLKTVLASVFLDMYEIWTSTAKEISALIAAGGLDKNRGNAEELRRYWTTGKGGAKIRWGTPGDWTRCVRQLSKYMGPRAKGYCQLRHKDATGIFTGSRANPGTKKGRVGAAGTLFSNEQEFTNSLLSKSELVAKAADARQKVGLVASAIPAGVGAKFKIPVLIPEEVESGDGRKFLRNAISFRELPVPLLWQIKTGSGHDGSVVVGRIDYIERTASGMGNASGVFDRGPYGQEAERLVRNGFLRGVSVDLDQFEAKEDKKPKKEASDDGQEYGKDKLTVNKARIMAATIVAKPAFQECTIFIDDSGDQEDTVTPLDGVYEESLEAFSDVEPILASGYLESEIPMTPPADWFANPKLTRATPLTIDKDGRVYGHIAAWNVNHIGLPRSTKPPRSRSGYAYFHTGVCSTAEGTDVPVGQLTLAGGHAPLNADAASAAKHYDDTASAIADVHVGEDQFGIYCAGSLRPNVTEMQVRALRASAPSGDWRPINGSLELVAVCQVNVPGFPIARAMVASGKIMALVAAGASHMALMKSQAVGTLIAKSDMLGQLAATAPDLKSRVREAKKKLREATLQSLTASAADMREKALVAAAVAEFAKFSEEERMSLAKEGKALPDGSYPIRDEADLKNAIQAYGRAKASERREVRKHIIKRARQLKKSNLVPQQWQNADSMEAAEIVASLRSRIDAVVAAAPMTEEISEEELKKLRDAKEDADIETQGEIDAAKEKRANRGDLPTRDEEGRSKFISGVNQPRDARGKYRKVLARLKQNLGVAGLSRALQKVEEAENLDFAGDYAASAKASDDLLGLIDRLDTEALNPRALENVRLTAAELGKTMANLPLPFGKDASKLKFSDLPTGLKDLIEQMVTRVEAKIGKKDADTATQDLRSYMSGADVYSQGEVQSQMSKLLRLLT